jgi:hypothetical protein
MPNPRQPHGLQNLKNRVKLAHKEGPKEKEPLSVKVQKKKEAFKCQNLASWFSYKGFIGQQWLVFTWVQFGVCWPSLNPKYSHE